MVLSKPPQPPNAACPLLHSKHHAHSCSKSLQQPHRSLPKTCGRRRQAPASAIRCSVRPGGQGREPQQLISSATRRTVLKSTAAGVLCCAACGRGGATSNDATGVLKGRLGWYDRYFAFGMATTMDQYEAEIAPLKRRLFSAAVAPGSRVLELGMGTAPNLKYYSWQQDVNVTGVDVNAAMQPYAQEAARAANLPPERFRLVLGDVQELPLENDSFDVVVCTLVLCSVPDVQAALREAARVLKPGGRFLYIEHVFAPAQQRLLQLQQRLLDPLQRLAADNCHLTRDTGGVLRNSGIFCRVEAEPDFEVQGMGLIAPHVAGIAVL